MTSFGFGVNPGKYFDKYKHPPSQVGQWKMTTKRKMKAKDGGGYLYGWEGPEDASWKAYMDVYKQVRQYIVKLKKMQIIGGFGSTQLARDYQEMSRDGSIKSFFKSNKTKSKGKTKLKGKTKSKSKNTTKARSKSKGNTSKSKSNKSKSKGGKPKSYKSKDRTKSNSLESSSFKTVAYDQHGKAPGGKNSSLKKQKDALRLTTWNVHEWKPAKSQKNTRPTIEKAIKRFNADIIGLQEVVGKSAKSSEWSASSCDADPGTHEVLRNEIWMDKAFKTLEIKKVDLGTSRSERCMIMAAVEIRQSEDPLIVGVVHFDADSGKERLKNVKKATASLEQMGRKHKTKNIVLMGDFNSYRRQDYNKEQMRQLQNLKEDRPQGMRIFEVLDFLKKQGWKDTFEWANQTPPINTNSYGGRIDYIFLHPKFVKNVSVKNYPFYSTASDHVAILSDLMHF